MLFGAVLLASGIVLHLSPSLPSTDVLKDAKMQTPLKIYTADGRFIAEFGEQKRIPLNYDEIPKILIQAILAAEDAQFYEHSGVSIKGLTRAAVELLLTGSIQSGGSTITMQVAKNFFFSSERSFKRKFNEILLALKIEQNFTKDEILTLYINKIYLGQRAYGFGAAAHVYYGKELDALNLAQIAMLAGLPKAPSATNPISNPDRAKIRRDWILSRMFALSMISKEDYQDAIDFAENTIHHDTAMLTKEVSADHMAEMVRDNMVKRFGDAAYRDGYTVVTTLQSTLQQSANLALRNGLLSYDQRHGYRGASKNTLTSFEAIRKDPAFLKKFPSSEPIEAALIIDVNKTEASVLRADGSLVKIGPEQFSWARSYISANRQGSRPTTASELFHPGDIIYIAPNEESHTWQVSQIPQVQGALVSLNSQSGAVIALVGGFDFAISKFNRAAQAKRQAGSNLKPFIYAAALNKGYTPASIINDAPLIIDDPHVKQIWQPANSDGKFLGPMRLREALYKSRNLVSIRILQDIGTEYAVDYLSRFGFIKKELPHTLSLALGSASVTPLEMATAYATLSNGGYKIEPYFIETISNSEGEIIYQAQPATVCANCFSSLTDTTSRQNESETIALSSTLTQNLPSTLAPKVMDERIHYLINNILQDVVKKGTAYNASKMQRDDIAGKTGTTNDLYDAWFSGYSPEIATSVWVGFDEPQTLGRLEFGSRAALPIWIEYMTEALKNRPSIIRPQPEGIVAVRINPETGEAASSDDYNAMFELFLEENTPTLSNDFTRDPSEHESSNELLELF
jgi:penicillin-binding protein 1A